MDSVSRNRASQQPNGEDIAPRIAPRRNSEVHAIPKNRSLSHILRTVRRATNLTCSELTLITFLIETIFASSLPSRGCRPKPCQFQLFLPCFAAHEPRKCRSSVRRIHPPCRCPGSSIIGSSRTLKLERRYLPKKQRADSATRLTGAPERRAQRLHTGQMFINYRHITHAAPRVKLSFPLC